MPGVIDIADGAGSQMLTQLEIADRLRLHCLRPAEKPARHNVISELAADNRAARTSSS